MSAEISPSDKHLAAVAERRARAADMEQRLCEVAAHTHAAMAELAALAAEFDELEGWCAEGLRSFAHWLSVSAGFAPQSGNDLLRVGQALRELPLIRAAFAAGRLSFDAVRELTRVATAADESLWLDVASAATGGQLVRICRACRRVLDLDTRGHADEQLRRRGLWSHVEDDGMMSIRALLLPEEGALVWAAIEAAMRADRAEATDVDAGVAGTDQAELALEAVPAAACAEAETETDTVLPPNAAVSGEQAVPNPSELWPSRRADALVALCENTLAGGTLVADPATLPMLVHVDVGVLTGAGPDGRRHIEGGPALSLATIQRIGCDASVIAITEKDGIPINVGRKQRIVPRSLRIAVQNRDHTCRFPACVVPARHTHAHHLEFWGHLGETERENIVSLCHFHHRRLHDGVYVIRGNPDAELIFETADGRPILRPPREVDVSAGMAGLRAALHDGDALAIDADTARPRDVTARMDLHYVVSSVVDGVQTRRGSQDAA